MLYMKQQIADLCGELNYAIRVSRKRLPLVEKSIVELIEQQNRQKRLLEDLHKKYDEKMSKLNQKQGVVNDRLKSLKERKNYMLFSKLMKC